MSGGDGCPLCEAMGLHWSRCAGCGGEFIWRAWTVSECGPVAFGIAAEDLAERDAFESPFWTGELPPASCEQCSGGVGYRYRAGAVQAS